MIVLRVDVVCLMIYCASLDTVTTTIRYAARIVACVSVCIVACAATCVAAACTFVASSLIASTAVSICLHCIYALTTGTNIFICHDGRCRG